MANICGITRLKEELKKKTVFRVLLYPVLKLRYFMSTKRRFDKFYGALFDNVQEGSLVVSLPSYGSKMEFDFRSDLLKRVLRDKDYEPSFSRIVKTHLDPSRDALDIGANVGLFTVLMASLVSEGRKVLAVEPTPGALHYLHRNINRNGRKQSVIVFEGVASDKIGKTVINTIPGKEEYSSICEKTVRNWSMRESYKSIEVECMTVDNLVDRYQLNPGFMKIDTEGAEYLVLSGAKNVLLKYKPIILVELVDEFLSNFGQSTKDVIRLLESYGYKIENAKNPSLPIEHPFCGEILALPSDMADATLDQQQ